jgi:hypothetical protein
MTNRLFLVCLLTGLVCAYGEYYWIQHGYRSLAFVASKCPKSTLTSTRSQEYRQATNNETTTSSILNWLRTFIAHSKEKSVVPIVCETFEIHADPRSIFILVKTFCLIGLTLKLISTLKTVPTLIRTRTLTRNQSNLLTSMPKGDSILHQSKLFETANGKLGHGSTSIDKRTLAVR